MNDAHALTAENLLRVFPEALRNDESMVALARSIAAALEFRGEEIRGLAIYTRIDELPEGLLDILAKDFKVDWYDPDYTVEEKRQTLKDSWHVHRTLGTKSAVETAISAIFPETKVLEWFEYDGAPYHFKLDINLTDDPGDAERQKKVLERLDYYKPLRACLDNVNYFIRPNPSVICAGVNFTGSITKISAEIPIPPEVGAPHIKMAMESGVVLAFSNERISADIHTGGDPV